MCTREIWALSYDLEVSSSNPAGILEAFRRAVSLLGSPGTDAKDVRPDRVGEVATFDRRIGQPFRELVEVNVMAERSPRHRLRSSQLPCRRVEAERRVRSGPRHFKA